MLNAVRIRVLKCSINGCCKEKNKCINCFKSFLSCVIKFSTFKRWAELLHLQLLSTLKSYKERMSLYKVGSFLITLHCPVETFVPLNVIYGNHLTRHTFPNRWRGWHLGFILALKSPVSISSLSTLWRSELFFLWLMTKCFKRWPDSLQRPKLAILKISLKHNYDEELSERFSFSIAVNFWL